jgi:hypothetical protein
MKKITMVMFAAVMMIAALPINAFAAEFTTEDALKVLKYAAESGTLSAEEKERFDVNYDGKVDTTDALRILKAAAGVRLTPDEIIEDAQNFARKAIDSAFPMIDGEPVILGKILVSWEHRPSDVSHYNATGRFDLTFNITPAHVNFNIYPPPAELPEALFASNAQECETLIYIYRTSQATGRYSDGQSAYTDTYYVQVINVREKTAFRPVHLATAHPPQMKLSSGPGRGGEPIAKLADYILELSAEL